VITHLIIKIVFYFKSYGKLYAVKNRMYSSDTRSK